MVNVPDPCNVVPDSTIPAGLSAHRHHAVHHVVGRIKHSIHHKFPVTGPHAPAPTPFGCEKHAILPPRPGGNGIVGPGAVAPATKLAAVGGAGAGLVALGGIGGLVIPAITKGKTTFSPPQGTPVSTNPGPGPAVPPVVPSPPGVVPHVPQPTIPGTPTVVPEPSTIVVFMFAVGVALAARYLHRRRTERASVLPA